MIAFGIIYKHKVNIRRIAGTENKVGAGTSTITSEAGILCELKANYEQTTYWDYWSR